MNDSAYFLLTRFNVPIGNVPVNLGLTDAWLEHRFALFENFCLPSVLAQQHKDFHWLILIDERTAEKWRDRLRTDVKPLSLARLIPVRESSEAVYIAEIAKIIHGTAVERVVTTRLDNDDAIARDYLAGVCRRVQSLRHKDRYYVINYRKGCQVSYLGAFAVSEKRNPFLTMVSPKQPLRTADHSDHAGMNRFGTVIDDCRFFDRSPHWLQSIHGNNIANRLQRKRVRMDPEQLEVFGLGNQWRQLLQPGNFSVPTRAAAVIHFTHHQPGAPWNPSGGRSFEIAMTGWEGDYIFERIRGSRSFHESDLLRFLGFLLKGSPGVIIDASANIGNDAVFFTKVLGAEVICIEPNPAAVVLLKANLSLNEISHRARIVGAAASERHGKAKLKVTSLLDLGATQLVEKEGEQNGDVVTAPLDDLVTATEAGRVCLVKISVEGPEASALRGMLRLVESRRPVLVVEATAVETLQRVQEILRPFGYFRAGPFCTTPTYVFSHSKLDLWRAMVQRRLFRSAARLRRKLKI